MSKFSLIPKFFHNWLEEERKAQDRMHEGLHKIENILHHKKLVEDAEVTQLVVICDMNRGANDIRGVLDHHTRCRVHLVCHPEQLHGIEVKNFLIADGAEMNPKFMEIMQTLQYRIR